MQNILIENKTDKKIGYMNLTILQKEINCLRKELFRFLRTNIYPLKNIISGNKHMEEWEYLPMNYWRYIEYPLTLNFLLNELGRDARVLDIGSPKLIALYLSYLFPQTEIVSTDISDYFLSDLKEFKQLIGLKNLILGNFDGQKIPMRCGSIDHVYSVSVLEHIPESGDMACSEEIGRVLRTGGSAIFVLPYHYEYCEEWVTGEKNYWSQFSKEVNGKIFFQKRYFWNDIVKRIIEPSGLELENAVLTAEKPIQKNTNKQFNGKIDENYHYLGKDQISKIFLRLMSRMRIPQPMQIIHSWYSKRYHYFTLDRNDRNIKNIVIKLRKKHHW